MLIGIGAPIAERPSLTTGHTGHVSGGSVVAFGYAGTRRLLKADNDKNLSITYRVFKNTTLRVLQHPLHFTRKKMLFNNHDHLPGHSPVVPFGPLLG